MPPIVLGDRVEQLYDQGRNAIEQGRYDRAVERFDQLIEMKSTRTDAALYWKAYSEDWLGDRSKALTTLSELQKQFTDSRWIKDAKALELELRQAAGQAVPTDLQNDEELKLLALRGLIQNDPDQAFPIVEKMLNGSNTPRVRVVHDLPDRPVQDRARAAEGDVADQLLPHQPVDVVERADGEPGLAPGVGDELHAVGDRS